MLEYIEGYDVFYDPVADYMEEFFSWNTWSCFQYKYQICYHWLFSLHLSFFILIKHDEEARLWDQLSDWLDWHFSIT